MQSKYGEMHSKEFSPILRNEFQFFCVSLYIDCLINLCNKFQIAYACDVFVIAAGSSNDVIKYTSFELPAAIRF